MLSRFAIVVVVAVLSLGTGLGLAEAASLTVHKGQVLISDGGGYREAGNADLKVGDTVLVNPDSAASVSFGEGCAVTIEPGTVFIVPETPPCTAATTTGEGGAGGLAGAAPYAIGIAAIGGGAALIASAGGSGSDGTGSGGGGGGGGGNPASP